MNVGTPEGVANELMKKAFEALKDADKSRESSLTVTKLEEAMMWNNKDRAIKGQLAKSETHVE